MIVIAGRCGSTWLGRMLQDTHLVGAPNEWFNTQGLQALYERRAAHGFTDYVEKVALLHPVFGFQINPERLFYLEELIDVDKSFSDFSVIDLHRRDFVAQAFSFARARKSGKWHNVIGPRLDVSDEEVWQMIHYIVRYEQRIEKWYSKRGICPLRLAYEDIISDTDAVIIRILSNLSRRGEIPEYSSPPQRQKRNGDGGTDSAFLSFLQRNSDRIEAIHANRQKIDTSKFLSGNQ